MSTSNEAAELRSETSRAISTVPKSGLRWWAGAWIAIALTISAFGQTQVDLRTQTRGVDFTAAPSTKPFKAGAALPASCAVGELYFKIDAPAGINIYACTATNIWSVQTGSSGSSLPSMSGNSGKLLGTDGTSAIWQALAGDVTGAPGTNVVGRIQGRSVATTTPSSGQALVWSSSNSRWEPQTISGSGGGGVNSVDGADNTLISTNPTGPNATLKVNPAYVPLLDADNALVGNNQVNVKFVSFSCPNNATGTAMYRVAARAGTFACQTAASAVGVEGVVQGNAGTSGSAIVAYNGLAQCLFDGATVAWDYVSVAADGRCHDNGGTTTGSIGQVTTTNGSAGTYTVRLALGGSSSGGGGGSGDVSSNTGASADGEAALFSGTGGKTIKRATLTAPVVKSASGVQSAATASDVVVLFNSGSCSGYLKSDGTCDVPAGGGGSSATMVGASGQYWGPFGRSGAGGVGTASAANETWFAQFSVPAPVKVSKILYRPNGSSRDTGNLAFALYDSSCNLIQQTTTVPAAGTGLTKSANFGSQITLGVGIYFAAWSADTGAAYDILTANMNGVGTSGTTSIAYMVEEMNLTHMNFKGTPSTGTSTIVMPATCGPKNSGVAFPMVVFVP